MLMAIDPEIPALNSPSGLPSLSILVVEDPFVSSFLRAVLQRAGHRVTTASPSHGVELVDSGTPRPQLLITNTPQIFLRFADNLPTLYIAADPDPAIARKFAACRALRKPFRNQELLHAVEELAHGVLP